MKAISRIEEVARLLERAHKAEAALSALREQAERMRGALEHIASVRIGGGSTLLSLTVLAREAIVPLHPKPEQEVMPRSAPATDNATPPATETETAPGADALQEAMVWLKQQGNSEAGVTSVREAEREVVRAAEAVDESNVATAKAYAREWSKSESFENYLAPADLALHEAVDALAAARRKGEDRKT